MALDSSLLVGIQFSVLESSFLFLKSLKKKFKPEFIIQEKVLFFIIWG